MLPTGLGNPPAVRVLTGKTGRFGFRPVQKPDSLTLGGATPDPYPSTHGFRRVWLDPSVSISGSAFWVSHLSLHSDMLLRIVQYWHWYFTVHFRRISCLDVQNKHTHPTTYWIWASTERQQSVNRASTERQRYLALHLRYYEWCLITSIHKEGYGSLYRQICTGYSSHIFRDSNNLFHLQSYH